jgi:5-methylcytosine-specific restriction endonuclease McrA
MVALVKIGWGVEGLVTLWKKMIVTGMKSQSRLQDIDRRLDKIHASQSQKHKLKAEIKQRFGRTCAYCGCTPRFLTLDHVVPQTQGGLNTRSNLAAVCQRCNLSKGSRPLWVWWQASSCWDEERAIRFAETVLACKIARLSGATSGVVTWTPAGPDEVEI